MRVIETKCFMATRALEMVGSNRFCKSRKTDSSRTSGTFKMLHIVVPIVRDDLPGTAGTRDAAKPSISSDSGGGLGRSLG